MWPLEQDRMARASDEHSAFRRCARPWWRLAILGGLTLAASFFMPAIKSCNSDVIPASEMAGIAQAFKSGPNWWDGARSAGMAVCVFFSAYLLGLVLAMMAFAKLRQASTWSRILAGLFTISLLGTAMVVLIGCILEITENGLPPWDAWGGWLNALGAPLIVLCYFLLARRRPHRTELQLAFIATLWMLCWFGSWIASSFSDVRYGMWLSFPGAAVLLVCTLGEARAVTGQTWRRTLWQLLTARLALSIESRGRCPKCDYFLYGLNDLRCPECGRPFTFQELGVSAGEMAFRSDSGLPA